MTDQSHAAKRCRVYVPADDGPWDLIVEADAEELRQRYGDDLKADGLFDASDEAIIKHVYQQNPDAPKLEVESEW